MKRPPAVATCLHCGREFVKRDADKQPRYCSRACSNSRRSRSQRVTDEAGADYPGVEWGPLPPALLVRVAARVLAVEYAAWAAKQKGATE